MKKFVVALVVISIGCYLLGYYYYRHLFYYDVWFLEFLNRFSEQVPNNQEARTVIITNSGKVIFEDEISLVSLFSSIITAISAILVSLFSHQTSKDRQFKAICVSVSSAVLLMALIFLYRNLSTLLM